jgi:inner membrane protein
MSNGATHRLTSGVGVGLTFALQEYNETGELSAKPLVAGSIASILGSLPDLVEPATNPHHRQFFHSYAFAIILGGVTYQIYKWEPESTLQDIIRFLLLVASGAYLIHLLYDSQTPRGLPIIGKL